MKKAITTIIVIWLAISFTYTMITQSILPFDEYLEHINQHLPSFSDVYNELVEGVKEILNFSSGVNFNGGLFNTILMAFKMVFNLLGSTFKLIWEVVIIPVRLLIYLFKVITAFIPFMN